MIMPPISSATPRPAIWDVAMLVVLASVFVLVTLRRFFASEPVPIGDPLFTVGMHGHGQETRPVRI